MKIKEFKLINNQGKSNKFYNISIIEEGDFFYVEGDYGPMNRINSPTNVIIDVAMDLESAEISASKFMITKLKKGYVEVR